MYCVLEVCGRSVRATSQRCSAGAIVPCSTEAACTAQDDRRQMAADTSSSRVSCLPQVLWAARASAMASAAAACAATMPPTVHTSAVSPRPSLLRIETPPRTPDDQGIRSASFVLHGVTRGCNYITMFRKTYARNGDTQVPRGPTVTAAASAVPPRPMCASKSTTAPSRQMPAVRPSIA
jgi:hypothetical protein